MFNFPILPYYLKAFVVKYVDIDDSLKFLRTNFELRSLTGFAGPFPRSIEEVKVDFFEHSAIEPSKYMLHVKITDQNGNFVTLSIKDKKIKVNYNRELSKVSKYLTSNSAFSLLKRFDNARSLSLNFQYLEQSNELNQELKEKLREYFCDLKFLHLWTDVSRLELNIINPEIAKIIFDYFAVITWDKCYLGLDWPKKEMDIFIELLESPLVKRCKVISLKSQENYHWNEIFAHQPKILLAMFKNWEEFIEIFEIYLEKGISMKQPMGTVGLYLQIYENNLKYWIREEPIMEVLFDWLKEKVLDTVGIEILPDESNEALSISEYFQAFVSEYKSDYKESCLKSHLKCENSFKLFFERWIFDEHKSQYFLTMTTGQDEIQRKYFEVHLMIHNIVHVI